MKNLTGRSVTDAEDVETKTSAPATLAAASTFSVPSMFTRLVRFQNSIDRSPGRMMAAVWKTVSGSSAASLGQGLAKAASTDAGSVMSVFT